MFVDIVPKTQKDVDTQLVREARCFFRKVTFHNYVRKLRLMLTT